MDYWNGILDWTTGIECTGIDYWTDIFSFTRVEFDLYTLMTCDNIFKLWEENILITIK